jgi:hypothetical protein
MSQQSILNSSLQPLLAERAFLGVYEEVLFFGSVNFQFKASTNCEIIIFQTSDKINVETDTIPYNKLDGVISISRSILGSFLRITVRNTEAVNQTQFSLQTIYKAQAPSITPINTLLYSEAIAVNGVTPSVFNFGGYKYVSYYGETAQATNLTIQLSVNGSDWYDTQYVYTIAPPGEYGVSLTLPFRYLRLKSSAVSSKLVLNISLA